VKLCDLGERPPLGKRPFGIDFQINLYVHPGAGAYICGEESALLNSLEGKRGETRLRPPFPAQVGAFGAPTIVNNVETIASVPDIIRMGGKAWSELSRFPGDGGVRLYGVSGHVKRPGIFEAPVGLTLRELIYDFGGGMLHDHRPLKAVAPGGSSTPDEVEELRLEEEPALCLQCHPTHRIGSSTTAETKQAYYTRCTDCHSQIHGTDLPSPSGRGNFIQ